MRFKAFLCFIVMFFLIGYYVLGIYIWVDRENPNNILYPSNYLRRCKSRCLIEL